MNGHGSSRDQRSRNLCVLACAISALLAAPARGTPRIDGGGVVEDAVEAPWAVMIALD